MRSHALPSAGSAYPDSSWVWTHVVHRSSEMRIYSDKGNNMIADTTGFRYEFGRVDTVPRVELEAMQAAPYRELFVGKPHQNWIALDDTDSPVLVSILKDKAVEGADENTIRAIVRTAEGDSFVTHGALSAAIANKARIRKFSTKVRAHRHRGDLTFPI